MDERPAKPVTKAYLQRAAVAYLERYASSASNLTSVLERKVHRRAGADAARDPAIEALIGEVVATAVGIGLVDDRRYAETKAASLRRRGASGRKIAAALAAKGVDPALVQAAVVQTGVDELAAARRLAQRRRLGPWRRGDPAEHRIKDMAALARAGFGYDVIRRVMAGEPDEA